MARPCAPVLLAALACGAASAAPAWRTLWADEFDGAAGAKPDASRWAVKDEPGLSGNKELEYYSPTSVFLDGSSNLVLESTNVPSHGFAYTSGWVDTHGGLFNASVRDVPVKWEISAQLPAGQGMWPAFWLMPDWAVCWPMGGEIDILERINDYPGVHGALHYNQHNCGGGAVHNSDEGAWSPTLPFDPAAGYHRYSVVWSPPPYVGGGADTLAYAVDDDVYVTSYNISTKIPTNLGFYLILNTAVGGDWPGPPNATTTFPQLFKVDWVRFSELR